MIVTCPNCYSRFSVLNEHIGETGRKVRCTVCEETWFQEHIEEDTEQEGIQEESEDFAGGADENAGEEESVDDLINDITCMLDNLKGEDAQESVHYKKPVSNGNSPKGSIQKNKGFSYAVAACLFIFIFSYLLIFAHSIMRTHPSTQVFYAWFGIEMQVPGVGLVFNDIDVGYDGKKLRLSGDIVNLDIHKEELPVIEVLLKDEQGEPLGKWFISPEKEYLAAEETFSFTSTHVLEGEDDVVPEKSHVQIRFTLGVPEELKGQLKIAEANGGNTQALHPNVSDPPSDLEAP